MTDLDLAVIGGGQSGLAAAHAARRAGLSFLMLEAGDHAAGSWASYYDSLTLLSPARYSELRSRALPDTRRDRGVPPSVRGGLRRARPDRAAGQPCRVRLYGRH